MRAAAIHFAAALLTSAALVAPAYAQVSYLVATGTESGELTYPITEPTSGSREVAISFGALTGHSYCCEIALRNGVTPNVADQAFFTSFIGVSSGQTVPHANRGTSDPVLPFFSGLSDPAAARKCGIATSVGYIKLDVNIGADNGLAADYSTQCLETTLFGGFNTSVTDFNFLEISNTLNRATDSTETINVRIDATNAVTNAVVFNGATVQVAAGERRDIDIHSVSGSGAFGPIRLSHDGPPGSIKAVVSQYRIVTTSPFDFEPVAREVLTTRARN